jgi:hypothetical protein
MKYPMIGLSYLFLDVAMALMTLISFDMICKTGHEGCLQLVILLAFIGHIIQIISITQYNKTINTVS